VDKLRKTASDLARF